MKIALIINFELHPPWSDGIKVFARGLFDSIVKTGDAQVTIDNLDNGTKNYDYDHAHIVYPTGPMTLMKAAKRLKRTTILKHIVTPAVGLRTAINTNIFYNTVGALYGTRLVKCFSSEFVAHSYFMRDNLVIPPPIDTEHFIWCPKDWDKLFCILGESGTKRWLNNIKKSDGGLVLYSGPLSKDRFPYIDVLNALKHAKCQILVVGRFWGGLNNEAISYVNDIVSYARKIGIENKVSIVSRTLSEEEKIILINCADAIIQPFDSKLKNIAVDPPIFLLESMACAKPVISSKSHSLNSVVRNGCNGYAVDWHDPEQFSEALSNCLSCRQIGTNARDTILQNFSINAVAKKLRGMYDALSR
ncbi:MAG: glycosyltransferase [Nitrososphaeraceae archaeon]|nr:glycosyltransferase [Nitrososphaeraceae archaeon]